VSTHPEGSEYTADLAIYYDGESRLASDTSAVDIYRWDGNTWTPVSTGSVIAPELQIASTTVTEDGHYAAFLDLNRSTGVANESEELPGDAPSPDRIANYPNPFRGGTNIPLDLDRTAEVTVLVYNLLGQVVGRKAVGVLQPGKHDIRFEAPRLPSGTYPYVVRIDDRKVNGWMTITR
jgi:hypothetical protein